jgi:hypothetical protein
MLFCCGSVVENILQSTDIQRCSLSAESPGSDPDNAQCIETTSTWTRGAIIRSVEELRKHPAYTEIQLTVSPAQLAEIKRLGELAFKDPLLVTREGVIIDGYARKEYADRLGISTLACVELDIGEEEALRMILSKHRRSPGWNDYNRIRMAARLRDVIRIQARSNQQAGGHFKGSSKLTEANVRKEIAAAAGVCEGNVTKVDQLRDSDPDVLNALASGEIRIHRAWLWRGLTSQQQYQELRRHRLKRGLKQPVSTHALRHRATRNRILLTMAKLRELLLRGSSMPSSDDEGSELIEIGLIKAPGKTAILTTELYEALWAEGSAK